MTTATQLVQDVGRVLVEAAANADKSLAMCVIAGALRDGEGHTSHALAAAETLDEFVAQVREMPDRLLEWVMSVQPHLATPEAAAKYAKEPWWPKRVEVVR